MKSLIVTLFLSFFAITAFSQTICETTRVTDDPNYGELCGDNWSVEYDLRICTNIGDENRPWGWQWAIDNGTATNLDTGETYQLHVSSGSNNNPGEGGSADGYTYHAVGTVAGQVVIHIVNHVNYDGTGIVHKFKKRSIMCL
jgi:hypothetical protein